MSEQSGFLLNRINAPTFTLIAIKNMLVHTVTFLLVQFRRVCAGYVAPRGKVITAVVMATVMAMFGLYITVLVFTDPPEWCSYHPFEMVLSFVATLFGSVVACGVLLAKQQDRG